MLFRSDLYVDVFDIDYYRKNQNYYMKRLVSEKLTGNVMLFDVYNILKKKINFSAYIYGIYIYSRRKFKQYLPNKFVIFLKSICNN